jgi:hypothetical protein
MTSLPANPFEYAGFARVWDGWGGRRTVALETAGVHTSYVERPFGPWCTRAALPFGTPVFLDDRDLAHHAWLRSYFSLGGSLRTSATLFSEPAHEYPDVRWQGATREVVWLAGDWRTRVLPDVRRRAARAPRAGWTIAELGADQLPAMEGAIAQTNRRHGQPVRFGVDFFARMRQRIPEADRLRFIAARRDLQVGATWVVLAAPGCEFGWQLFATDQARQEGIAPYLTWAWLTMAEERACEAIDLGVSPTDAVRRFKESFGSRSAPYFTGVWRPSLPGKRLRARLGLG